MRKIPVWVLILWLLFSFSGCADTDQQDIATYESQIKHLESEVELLRKENEQLKKLGGAS